ncbi:hypothetical protein RHSIM_Rhsim03G0136800 [Rhododendron simsii]|uniref:Folylpolyglutamate synthase n=1 Tax=Rhododendron simsii TaxID=118357 RepID=A0A834HBE4_RHOSS|nr:hypothetical protein RHSIM_Rhsim03G0136800 [Rhododendron simsii]
MKDSRSTCIGIAIRIAYHLDFQEFDIPVLDCHCLEEIMANFLQGLHTSSAAIKDTLTRIQVQAGILWLGPIKLTGFYSTSGMNLLFQTSEKIKMPQGDDGSAKPTASSYDEAMDALSSLITKRSRADKSNKGDRFDFLFDYVKMLDLEEPISKMSVIHVAGTKGKVVIPNSSEKCIFVESVVDLFAGKNEFLQIFGASLSQKLMLTFVKRSFWHTSGGVGIGSRHAHLSPFLVAWQFLQALLPCQFQNDEMKRTWESTYRLYTFDTSAHAIIQVEKTSDDMPMPTYFRFLALLAFKIFSAEQVDVAILEVGLGGRFDATNVVQTPIVCGISSLGYDHMEILGNTLGEIAGEKAGIFKQGVPAFTVPQPEEAMRVLEEKASQLNVPVKVAPALDMKLLNGLNLGLHGEHQYLNAGLAIALCSTWLQKTGRIEVNNLEQNSSLPEHFIKGLTMATLQGRAQIVPDRFIDIESPGDLMFYLDGAHSPESMEVCAKWFSLAIKEGNKQELRNNHQDDFGYGRETPRMNSTQILLFNCMSVRDPRLLLPHLVNTCANHGVHFKKALFVPNISVYNKVWSSALPLTDLQVDLSWQLTLQKVWENLINSQKGITVTYNVSFSWLECRIRDIFCQQQNLRCPSSYGFSDLIGGNAKNEDLTCVEGGIDKERCVRSCENSTVIPSLPLAVKWLRDTVQQNKSVRLQVLVTGSLHLIGDLLRLVKK